MRAKVVKSPGDLKLFELESQSPLILAGQEGAEGFFEAASSTARPDQRAVGGIVPGVIGHEGESPSWALVLDVPEALDVQLVDPLEPRARWVEGTRSAFVLAEGLSTSLLFALEEVNEDLKGVPLFGLGCGSFPPGRTHPLLWGEERIGGRLILLLLPHRASVGISHGFKPVRGPFLAICARNRVVSLDLRPAAEVYAQALRELTGRALGEEELKELLPLYPLGFTTEGRRTVIRDPFQVTPEGHLLCVGDLPSRGLVRIMSAERESLLQAVKALPAPEGDEVISLAFDCVSRKLLLGEGFEVELEALRVALGPRGAGVLSLGEIGPGDELATFHNKSAVLCRLKA